MKNLQYYEIAGRFSQAMKQGGAFLTVKAGNALNTMTIGWAFIGESWGKDVFVALVRLSRHTHLLMDRAAAFTVSIPRKGELQAALHLCGTQSGRDMDKFVAAGITAVPAQSIDGAIVAECDLHLECRVVFQNDMSEEHLDESIATSYNTGDFHTMYFGKIVACYSSEE